MIEESLELASLVGISKMRVGKLGWHGTFFYMGFDKNSFLRNERNKKDKLNKLIWRVMHSSIETRPNMELGKCGREKTI